MGTARCLPARGSLCRRLPGVGAVQAGREPGVGQTAPAPQPRFLRCDTGLSTALTLRRLQAGGDASCLSPAPFVPSVLRSKRSPQPTTHFPGSKTEARELQGHSEVEWARLGLPEGRKRAESGSQTLRMRPAVTPGLPGEPSRRGRGSAGLHGRLSARGRAAPPRVRGGAGWQCGHRLREMVSYGALRIVGVQALGGEEHEIQTQSQNGDSCPCCPPLPAPKERPCTAQKPSGRRRAGSSYSTGISRAPTVCRAACA